MKKTSIAVTSLLLWTLFIAGCFWTKTDSKEEFTIASCNDYVKLMKCVAEKSGGGQEALNAVDQAIAAWKTLPEDQLAQTCSMAVDAVASNASAYVQLGCEVPTSNTPDVDSWVVSDDMVMSGSDVDADADMLTGEASSGEDTAVVESVVNEVVATGTAQ